MGTEQLPVDVKILNWSDIVLRCQPGEESSFNPTVELFDVSGALELLAQMHDGDDRYGLGHLLRLLANNVSGIAKVMDEKQRQVDVKSRKRGTK